MNNPHAIPADAIWDVLVRNARASELFRESFQRAWEDPQTGQRPFEYRFEGLLGAGGKFWWNPPGPYRTGRCPLYVNCYREDETPERMLIIKETNHDLKALVRALPRDPFVKGEQPVRVDDYPGTWAVVRNEENGLVEVAAKGPGGLLLVSASKVHRGHMEWVDDD